MAKEGNKLNFILIGVIILLLVLSIYFIYSDSQSKQEIDRLNQELTNVQTELNKVSTDKEKLNSDYKLLVDDVAEIYKTCMSENICRGRYPLVSWYCNNVGDEASNPSHICICDNSCNLKTTAI